MKKIAITLSIPSGELCATGQGTVYQETYIVEVPNLPKNVINAIDGKTYSGSVCGISFVKDEEDIK